MGRGYYHPKSVTFVDAEDIPGCRAIEWNNFTFGDSYLVLVEVAALIEDCRMNPGPERNALLVHLTGFSPYTLIGFY
jgi:hypothetical protein